MSQVKWGVLSTAKIAETQVIPAIRQSEQGTVYGVASGSGKEKEFAERVDIPNTYSSYQDLLDDEEIDAVYIPLPNNMHAEWCVKAARAKKHILSEKPIALSSEEFSKIEAACKEEKVQFMEGFMYRFHPQHEKVKEWMEEGRIGKVITIRSRFHFTIEDPDSDIRMKSDLGGGVTYDIGSYSINLMNYLLGGKPDSVAAFANYEEVDTHISAVMKYGDVLGQFDSSFEGPFIQAYEVTGTEGIIRVPHAFRPDLNDGIGVLELITDDEEETYEIQNSQYKSEVEAFHEAVLEGTSPAYSTREMEEHMRTVEAVVDAAKTQKVIFL